MKKELVAELLTRFEDARTDLNGTECWSARDLQEILGYTRWHNFQNAVDKAKEACSNVGENCDDHFLNVTRRIELPNNATSSRTKAGHHVVFGDSISNRIFQFGPCVRNSGFRTVAKHAGRPKSQGWRSGAFENDQGRQTKWPDRCREGVHT